MLTSHTPAASRFCLFLFLFVLLSVPGYASLSGTYTIDAAAAASSTNYKTFKSAVFDLTATSGTRPDGGPRNGPAVSAAVIFQVAAGTYSEQIDITAITGVSSTNTVTFDGGAGNAASRILSYASTTSIDAYTVRLNNSSWVNFKNLTIKTAGTSYGIAVHFYATSSNCRISRCVLEIGGTGATSTSSYFIPMLANGSVDVTLLSTLGSASKIKADSNIFRNGYYGLLFYGIGTTGEIEVTGNTFTDQYYYGVLVYGCNGFKCVGNTVTPRSNSSFPIGIYLYYSQCTNGNFHEISNNKVTDASYGIYVLYSFSTDTTIRCRMLNNMIGGGTKGSGIGILFSSCEAWDVYHNSVNADANGNAFYLSYTDGMDIRNNLFAQTSAISAGLPFYAYSVTGVMDYNNFFKAGSLAEGPLVNIDGIIYNADNFRGADGKNVNSLNNPPAFVGVKDLHSNFACSKGTPLNVSTDFDGDARSGSSPVIGADEARGTNGADAGVSQILNPSFPLIAGTSDIKVVIKNYSRTLLTSANVHYSINGGAVQTVAWSGSLATCDTAIIVFSGSQQFTFTGGSYNFITYTSSPNGGTDQYKVNDTLKNNMCISMSGTYTIDFSGSGSNNFKTFNEAVARLTCGGIGGPVIFQVAAGTYTEQVDLWGIKGTSATNTITFDGGAGNAASRIVQFNYVTGNFYYTFRIRKTPFVRLRNLTIRTLHAQNGTALHIMGSSDGCSIKNCVIEIGGAGSASTSSYLLGVLVNNNDISTNPNYISNVKNLEIDSNIFRNSYTCLYIYGSNNIAVRGNSIINGIRGAYFASSNGVLMQHNDISLRKISYSEGIELDYSQCSTGVRHEISSNRITDAGATGITIYSSYSTDTSQRCLLANNMVGGGFRSAGATGIIISYSDLWDIVHNSVNLDTMNTSQPGSVLYIYYCTDLKVKNNHFALTNPGIAGTVFLSWYVTYTELDNNNYFRSTYGSLLDLDGTMYFSADFKGAQGYNANSINTDPNFKGKNDLHLKNGCLEVPPFPGITEDLDGNSRSLVSPDIGADEVQPGGNDAGVFSVLSPNFPLSTGLQDVQVVLKNYGGNTLTSADISYSVNGGAVQTQSWTGSLGTCDTAVITFTGSQQYNFTGVAFTLKTYSSLPNGISDTANYNDTTVLQLCTSLSGTYTINPSGSGSNNFTSFAAAINQLECGGVGGPVILNVTAGTYTEQLDLASIPGTSGINTVTFRGNDSVTTILTFSGSQAAPHTFKLDRAKHINIRNLTIAATGTTYGIAIHMTNASDSNEVSGCIIKMSGSSTSMNLIGVGVMGIVPGNQGNYGNNNTIRNCLIDGGGISIAIAGQYPDFCDGNTIKENSLLNASTYGIYSSMQDGMLITGNRLETRLLSGSAIGLYGSYLAGVRLEGNYVRSGTYGFSLNNFGISTNRSAIVNNILFNQTYPIYGSYLVNTDIFHNTVFQNSNVGGGLYLNSGSGIDIRNNIFYKQTGNGYCLYINNFSSITSCNYNNYYSKGGGTLAYVAGIVYSSLNTLQAAFPLHNQKSISTAPDFVSTTLPDLHLKASAPSPSGDSSVRVAIDYDKDARCMIAPTIGADESKFVVPAPLADFSVADTAWINSPTNFYNAAIAGLPEMYTWDILNDSTIDFVSRNASYTFTAAGIYKVKLTTTNCSGTASIVKDVIVDTPKVVPVVNFTVDLTEIDVWQSIHLLDSSLNGPTSWLWTVTPSLNVFFIPGNNVFNPEVSIGEPGLYTICLTATNDVGSATICKTALVKVKYITNMCVFPFDTRASDGKVYDSGGPTGNYTNSENCTFLINPCATSISLTFTEFSMLSGDTLKVFDGNDTTGIPLHTGKGFTGSVIPAKVTAKSGKIFMQVKTNTFSVSTGFTASWTSVNGIFPPPQASFITNTVTPFVGFEGSPMRLTSTSAGADLIYSWDIDNDGIEDFNTKTIEFTFFSPGINVVKLTITNCGGTDVFVQQVSILTPTVPPVANFTADLLVAATTDIVSFTDFSDLGPFSWSWSFSPATVMFMNGTDSTWQNPQLRFLASGTYTVKLSATNAIGTDDTIKIAYIKVIAYCTPGVNSLNTDVGISKVELKGIVNVTTVGQKAYSDYSGNGQYALLALGERATIRISRNTNGSPMSRKAWIDFNLDGVFDAAEKILEEAPTVSLTYTTLITIPKTAVKGFTRMRVAVSNITDPNTPCGPHNIGEFEDYRIIIIADTMKPVITLTGTDTVNSELWYHFNDPGYFAQDNVDGNISTWVKVVSTVDTSKVGYYTIKYNVTDSAGNVAVQRTRVVRITPDVTKPVITLIGGTPYYHEVKTNFTEPGFTATDYFNKNLQSLVQDSGIVDAQKLGTYIITYKVTDLGGNTTTIQRTVIVRDTQKPVVSLKGPSSVTHCLWKPYNDTGSIVNDNYWNGLVATVTGTVNTLSEGEYKLTFTAIDSSGNVSISVIRTVTVINCNVSVQEQNVQADVMQVYPNPSDGIFNVISTKPFRANEFKVYNSVGMEVSDFRLSALPTAGSYVLDIGNLPAGIYFIRLSQEGVFAEKRITLLK